MAKPRTVTPTRETVNLGLKTWTDYLGILFTLLEAGDHVGKKSAKEEIARMAAVADMLPDAIAVIKAGQRLRATPIVDDDFPELRDTFDKLTKEFLERVKT
jgi:hypothetical protein